MACFKARDLLAAGIKQLKVLPTDLPTVHLLQGLKKSLLGVHALQTSHHSAGRLAEGEMVAAKGVTADQSIAPTGSAYLAGLRVKDDVRFVFGDVLMAESRSWVSF